MILPQYKLTSASFFLKQDWDLSKPNKADLTLSLTLLSSVKVGWLNICQRLLKNASWLLISIYANRVSANRLNLFSHLWSTFLETSTSCIRIDIIFDLYHHKSINRSERSHWNNEIGILTKVTYAGQPLNI